MNNIKNKNGFLFNMLLLTIFFNISFPKAGIKLYDIPLTFGNIIFGITFISWLLKKAISQKVNFSKILILIIILSGYTLIKYLIIGNFLDNIKYIIPLVVYPLICYLTIDMVNSNDQYKKIIKVIIISFFLISIYALLQYIFGIEQTCIPGLTVNLTDYLNNGSNWYLLKNNGSGTLNTKLISTYQNGNLFGVNMLLIYPLVYFYYRKNNRIKYMYFSLILFVLCLFLSLSRSCWLGIILFILFGIILKKERLKNNFFRKIILLFSCVIGVFAVFNYFPSVAARFFNTDSWISMSGRTEGLISVLNNFVNYKNPIIWLIGSEGIIKNVGLAYEMIPLAILVQLGLIGVILFYSIIFLAINYLDKNNEEENAIRLSILIWAIVGCIEGALWLPPTALNLFIMIGLGCALKKIQKKENII